MYVNPKQAYFPSMESTTVKFDAEGLTIIQSSKDGEDEDIVFIPEYAVEAFLLTLAELER